VPVKELCRKHGFSEASYYLWRNNSGGMEVSDAKRLKALEAENARLKKLLAESMLENEVTREALRKKSDRCTGSTRAGALSRLPESRCFRPLRSLRRRQSVPHDRGSEAGLRTHGGIADCRVTIMITMRTLACLLLLTTSAAIANSPLQFGLGPGGNAHEMINRHR
jgi:putative transposase